VAELEATAPAAGGLQAGDAGVPPGFQAGGAEEPLRLGGEVGVGCQPEQRLSALIEVGDHSVTVGDGDQLRRALDDGGQAAGLPLGLAQPRDVVGGDDDVAHVAVPAEHRRERPQRPALVTVSRIDARLVDDVLTGGNLERLRSSTKGQPHLRNLDRWRSLIDRSDVPGLHRVLTGLDRESIEMREVSPMGGLLSPEERSDVLRMTG
jgi:hypothetical protein